MRRLSGSFKARVARLENALVARVQTEEDFGVLSTEVLVERLIVVARKWGVDEGFLTSLDEYPAMSAYERLAGVLEAILGFGRSRQRH